MATQTTAALFADAAAALFGDQWQAPAARALNMNLRTMQRIAAAVRDGDEYRLPPGVRDEMVARLKQHARRCGELAESIDWL